MSFKVWRKKSDNSVVGFCESTYTGFEPGGDLTAYNITTESTPPTVAAPPPSAAAIKLLAVAADPTVQPSVKALLAEIVK